MAKLRFSFDAKKLERDIKKQLNKIVEEEYSAIIEQTERRNEAMFLDRMCEDALSTILGVYDGNENYAVNGLYDFFPAYMRFSHKDIFNRLKNMVLSQAIYRL